MAWAFIRYPDTGGAHLTPEESVAWHEARGWVRHALPDGLDPNDSNAPFELDEALALAPLPPERILTEEETLALKGKELDAALDAAGLSKSGTADEKRTRLAEHEAELATPTQEEEVSNG